MNLGANHGLSRRKPLGADLQVPSSIDKASNAAGEFVAPRSTPAQSTPQEGTVPLLSRAVGTQGYVYVPLGIVNVARPEGTLFTAVLGKDVEIVTHFQGPNKIAPNPLPFGDSTRQSSVNSSKVRAQVAHAIAADASNSDSL
jgi:hypothetical protein